MKWKGNIQWRSSDDQIIQVGQFKILHRTAKLDYCIRKTMQKM